MDESMRIVVVGIAAPLVIGLLAGVGAGVIKSVGRVKGEAAAERRATHDDEGFVGARVLAVVGVTLGFFVAWFGVHGAGGWPPRSMDDRMFLLPPALGLIGLAGVVITAWRGAKSVGGEKRLGWMVSSACALMGGAIGTAVVLGPPLWNGTLPGTGGYWGVVWVQAVFGVWAALSAWSIGKVARPPAGARVSAAVVAIGLCAAVGAGLWGNGFQAGGQFGMGIAAVIAGLAVGVLALRGAIGPGAIAAMCGMLAALLSCGVMFSAVPWWVAGGLGCVAPAAWVAQAVVGRKMGGRVGAVVPVAVAAVVAGAVVAPGVMSLVRFVTGAE